MTPVRLFLTLVMTRTDAGNPWTWPNRHSMWVTENPSNCVPYLRFATLGQDTTMYQIVQYRRHAVLKPHEGLTAVGTAVEEHGLLRRWANDQ